MRRVTLDKLEPGMVMALNIERGDGMVLVTTGTELTESIISTVRRMVEVEAVMIEGSPFASPEEAEAWRQEELKKLIHRFSKVAGDPFMDRLKKLEAKRIAATD